ncbi:MAG: ADP-ribosylglycohydrolase family protein [Cyclobacteriaceae bacterium]
MEKKSHSGRLHDAVLGFVVGDALGVPHEFKSREEMDASPASGMTGYGTHNQPPGTWSDDTSLMLCLMESLSYGYDLQDLAKRFVRWYREAYWTAHGEVFDIGISTQKAIERMEQGNHPTKCGGNSINDNGNGALMRILPLVFYLLKEKNQEVRFQKVKEVASLTHGHAISHIGCFIYTELFRFLILHENWQEGIKSLASLKEFLSDQGFTAEHLSCYESIFDGSFAAKSRDDIRSTGFVAHTLEAALWCVNQASSCREAIYLAINLGEDTDTTAAVTGSLAAYVYGISSLIEYQWKMARMEAIFRLSSEFKLSLDWEINKKEIDHFRLKASASALPQVFENAEKTFFYVPYTGSHYIL